MRHNGYFVTFIIMVKVILLCAKTMDEMIEGCMTTKDAMDFQQTNNSVLVEMDVLYSMKDWHDIVKMSKLESASKDLINKRAKRTAARGEYRRWRNKVIPYLINGPFDAYDREQIRSAMADWMKYTCLKFTPHRGHHNFIVIQSGHGCSSYIGMAGGPQPLSLAPGCRYKPIILHELGHVIGFHHEHTRPDRDSFVKIHGENALFSTLFNFQRYSSVVIDNHNTPYDYASIMHYGQYAFSVNGQPTILTTDPQYQQKIGNSYQLSFRDIQLANAMYKCSVHCPYRKCPSNGFLGKDCKCWCPGQPYVICADSIQNDISNLVLSRTVASSIPTVPSQSDCQDDHFFCDAWSKSGECNKNPDYMLTSCRKSCKQCTDAANHDLVAANIAVARQLQANGGVGVKLQSSSSQQHTSHKHFNVKYQRNTSKTSKVSSSNVPKSPVRNSIPPLPQPRATVQPTKPQGGATFRPTNTQGGSTVPLKSTITPARPAAQNPVIPQGKARKCQDGNINCQSWAANKECEDKKSWMTNNCPVSCKICDPKCFDIWDNCELWSESGRCRHNFYKDLLQLKCKKTCGYCTSIV